DVAPRFHGGEHRDPARVTELQRAADVGGVKDVFDGDAVRAACTEQRRQFRVDTCEPVREGVARRRGNRAAGDEMMTASIRLHASVAGALGAGIDAEDSHPSTWLGVTLSGSSLDFTRGDPELVEGSKGHAREASISFSSISKFAQTCCTSSCYSMASIRRSICCASLPVSLT